MVWAVCVELKEAHERHKRYADKRRKDLEFEVGMQYT